MSKGSDINVGSIEEDVDELKSIMNLRTDSGFAYSQKNTLSLQKAIKNVLTDYTRQKQINEEHQKINGELREKVKELENENISKQKAYDDCYCEYKHYKQFESISIQKIIEKIEELKKLIEKIKEDNQYSNEIPLYEHDIKLLEELLQESEDK